MPRLISVGLWCAWIAAFAAEPKTIDLTPKSAFVHTAPQQAKPGEALQVDGSLGGTVNFEKLVLRYRGPGEEYVDVKMELQYGDLYRGTIPAARMSPPGVEYYVEGINAAGDRVPLFQSAGRPARVLVITEDGPAPEPKRTEPEPPPPARPEEVKKEEPKKEEPKKDEPKKPKKKCKKGKKCKDEEPPPEPVKPKKEEPPPKAEEPKKEEPRREPPAKAEEPKKEEPRKEEPKVAKKEEPVAAPSEPPRKRSELEEELAIYGAEDSSGVVTRIDKTATRQAQIVTTFTHAQLVQLAAKSVYDVLDLVPGLTVSRDVAGFFRAGVRGLRGDPEVLFLIDGHRLNNFFDGRALANLPIDNLERLEVIRGPSTADVGLGNFLAVINLVTRKDDGIRAAFSGGLRDAYDGHLGAAKGFGGLRLFLDADVLTQTGSRRAVLKDALEVSTIAQGKRTAADPAGFTNDRRLLVNVGAGAEYGSDSLGHLSLSGRFGYETRAALIGQYDTVGNDSKLDWITILGDLRYDRKLGELGRWHVRLFFDQQLTKRLFQLSPRDYLVGATRFPEGIFEQVSTGTRSFGLELGADLALPLHNKLGFGLSGELASLFDYSYLTNYTPGTNAYVGPQLSRPDGLVYPTEAAKGAAASRLGIGVFVQDEFTPFDRLTLQLGVRLDLAQLPTSKNSAITGAGLAAGIGPRAGIVFAPINSLALKAHYGRAWRVPTVQELAETIPNSDVNQGRFVGNPALQPAYVDSIEVGFEYAQSISDAKLKLKGSGYFESFTNPINPVDPTGNLVPYANRQLGVRVFGAEGEARVELSQRSNAWINASFFRAEDNGTVPAARLLTDTPQARANAGFSLPLGPYLNFDVTLRAGSERRNDSRTVLELIRRYKLPGYFLVGASLRTEPIFDHFELSVTGQNVFDFDQVDDVPRPDRITAGLPREGLQAFATLKAEL